jgi:hypothetical protein
MEIKGYLTNQWGFSETGRILIKYVKEKIEDIGIVVLDPFEECSKELNLEELSRLTGFKSRREYWMQFDKKVTSINNKLMRLSHCHLPILDGGSAIDDGVSSEIGYYAALVEEGVIPKGFGRIFALRTDIRLGENIGCTVNPQIEGYIHQTSGKISTTLDDWFKEIKSWYQTVNGYKK